MPIRDPRGLLSLVLRLVVALTFAAAAALKLQDPSAFAEQIANYQFFPESSYLLASAFPPIELLAGVGLVVTRRQLRTASALVLFGLLVAFTTALIRAWALDINLECGCFGKGSTEIGIWPVLRNTCLMAALLLDWRLTRPAAAPSEPQREP